MTHLRFIKAQFPKSDDAGTIEDILTRRLKSIRHLSWGCELLGPGNWSRAALLGAGAEMLKDVELSYLDRSKIRRRAERIALCRKAQSQLSHLARTDLERLELIRKGVSLIQLKSEHEADEIAAKLHGDMPWMEAATEIVWHAMRQCVKLGESGLRLPPLLLVGPPGIGKSAWARRLAKALSLPVRSVEATGEGAGFAITGLQRGWGTAGPGKPLEIVLRTAIGNPIIVVDEIEKAERPKSQSGSVASLSEALLPLLERSTAKDWECPYFRATFDMSWISYVMTANSLRGIDAPFLSRCHVVNLESLRAEHLFGFVRREASRRGVSEVGCDAILDVISEQGRRGLAIDLRLVNKMLERALILEGKPLAH
jgi:hypothetical protein